MTVVAIKKRAVVCAAALLLAALCAPALAWRELPKSVIEYEGCNGTSTVGKKILVAYDTEHGATAQIAAAVGDELCQMGYAVDVRLARNVDSLAGYEAVVVGSPIYVTTAPLFWLPGSVRFLRRFEAELAGLPVAYFINCTYLNDNTEERRAKAVEMWVNPVREKFPGILPVSIGTLAGEIFYKELYPVEWLLFKMMKHEEGDFREWDRIRAWAREAGEELL